MRTGIFVQPHQPSRQILHIILLKKPVINMILFQIRFYLLIFQNISKTEYQLLRIPF